MGFASCIAEARRGKCVFLDSDTFILPGFMRSIRANTLEATVIEKVYSGSSSCYRGAVSRPFPNQARHKQRSSPSHICNSGVIGMRSGRGESILEDTLHIIARFCQLRIGQEPWSKRLYQKRSGYMAIIAILRIHGSITITTIVKSVICASK